MNRCNDLNFLMSNLTGTPKININDGLYIESWVKTPDDIEDFLENLKFKVTQCSEEYIQRIELAASKAQDANESLEEEQGEQGRLNRIIASLNYDEVSTQ